MRRLIPPALALAVTAAFLVGSPASADHERSASPAHRHAIAALTRAEKVFDHGSANARTTAAAGADASLALRDLWLARGQLSGAERRQADALLARPTADEGNDEVDVFDYSPTELANLQQTCSAHFCVTYTTAVHAGMYVNSVTKEVLDNSATPTEAQTDLDVLEHVYGVEVGQLGFRPPMSDAATVDGTDNNRNDKIDIYLTNVGVEGIYGYCSIDSQSVIAGVRQPAYCVLDNDFAQFGPDRAKARNVTAAHEFFHAIQYNYDATESLWFMEGSAVWMEDEVYNNENDYLQYVAASPIRTPGTPFTYNGAFHQYGAFTIFKFLESYLRDRSAVRQALERASWKPGPNSLQALTSTLSAHHKTPRLAFAVFGAWNTLPRGGYPEAASYRPAAVWHLKTLTKKHRKAGTWRTSLAPLTNAPVVLLPGSTLSKHSRVRITVNGPNVASGGAATLQVRYRSGAVSLGQLGLNRKGDRTRSVTFNPKKVSSVVVVLTNGSTSGPRHGFSISAKAS